MNLGETILAWCRYAAGNPALLLSLIALPLIVLARWKNIYPTRILVLVVLLPVIPSLGMAFTAIATAILVIAVLFNVLAIAARVFGMITNRTLVLAVLLLIVAAASTQLEKPPVILIVDGLILAAMAIDLLSLPRRRDLRVERHCQKTASLRKKHRVSLTITNASQRNRTLLVKDDLPQEFVAQPDEFAVSLPARSRTSVKYDLRASRRGAFQLNRVYIQAASRFGLWKRIFQLPETSTINVYPDMKQLAEFEMLARTNRLSLMGVRRTRRIGQDNDFERLRDYTPDDNYKHIDWRSTARRRKLTVRDFQTSQSQRIIFLVDCGRMMTSQVAGLTLLDHSLNAMLMLSYIALRRGDSVGLICFSDQIHSFVPPRGGARQMNHLLSASFDRFPELVESRYGEAFFHLSKHCRKRSLVILITNVLDEINANQVHQHLSTMAGRHLPLGVLLRDHELFRAADANWHDDAGLYRAAAAAEIVCWRHEVIKDLQHQGVLSLDLYPEEMTAPLINQYLEVKARHLL